MKVNYQLTDERDFIVKYLSMVNTLLPKEQQLVDSEIELIIEFMLLPDDKFGYQRFSALAKRKVIENAAARGWKLTKINMNNKLYSMLDKNFLRRDDDKVVYLPKHLVTAFKAFKTSQEFKMELVFKK